MGLRAPEGELYSFLEVIQERRSLRVVYASSNFWISTSCSFVACWPAFRLIRASLASVDKGSSAVRASSDCWLGEKKILPCALAAIIDYYPK